MLLTQLLSVFGWGSLGFAGLAAAATLFGVKPAGEDLGSYLSILAIMALVSGSVIVAAHLRARQNALAARAVPSSLVAYLLFVLIALRWLNY